MDAILGIIIGAVLFAILGVVRPRGCTGHCADCTGHRADCTGARAHTERLDTHD